MEDRSIVSFVGYHEGSHCGYCKGEEPLKASVGIWAFALDVSHYNALLDRGMRRSGKYIYKPIIEKTCCPQYTIRLDVHRFQLSKSQKRVLRTMNEFLLDNKRPKVVIEEAVQAGDEAAKSEDKKMCSSSMSVEETTNHPMESASAKSGNEGVTNPEIPPEIKASQKKQRGTKKKEARRARAFERMRKKGVDIEEVKQRRTEKEALRRRTVESFILSEDAASKAAHKLEIKLVPLGSRTFRLTENESYNLYKKYQETIHQDFKCSKDGFENFLCSTPLHTDEPSPIYGTHHQQYRLDGKLIAVGVVDVLPRCLSSKYFFYDPEYQFLSLGTYAALREIALTRELSKTWPDLHYYYMGYYIESCPKMRYKSRFRPSDLLCNTSFTWVPFEDCKEALQNNVRVPAFTRGVPPPPQIPIGTVSCLYKRMAMKYSELLKCPGFAENETYMQDYARLVGPVAKEILLYRS